MRLPGMLRGWLIVVASCGPLATGVRGAGEAEEPRREVVRLVEESERARRSKDYRKAVTLADRAVERARQALAEDDPDRFRAEMARFGPLCDEAVARRDPRGALKIASEAAVRAGERGRSKAVLAWTEYAANLAQGIPDMKPEGMERQGIALTLAEFRARVAVE